LRQSSEPDLIALYIWSGNRLTHSYCSGDTWGTHNSRCTSVFCSQPNTNIWLFSVAKNEYKYRTQIAFSHRFDTFCQFKVFPMPLHFSTLSLFNIQCTT